MSPVSELFLGIPKQLTSLGFQSPRQPTDDPYCGIPNSTFDPTHVGPIERASVTKRLLGESELDPDLLDGRAEGQELTSLRFLSDC